MKKIKVTPTGVCCREINFELGDDNKIIDVKFIGGCPGNMLGIRSLAIGMDANEIADKFVNIRCGSKATSCPDQFAKALREVL